MVFYQTAKQPNSGAIKLQNRLVELETRVAFQEDTIEQLNLAINQQQQLDRLQQDIVIVKKRISEQQQPIIANEAEETPPPHY